MLLRGGTLAGMDKKIHENNCTDATRETARKAYQAYTANSDNLNFQGQQCPAWSDLPSAVRSHWCAVVISMDPSLYGEKPETD